MIFNHFIKFDTNVLRQYSILIYISNWIQWEYWCNWFKLFSSCLICERRSCKLGLKSFREWFDWINELDLIWHDWNDTSGTVWQLTYISRPLKLSTSALDIFSGSRSVISFSESTFFLIQILLLSYLFSLNLHPLLWPMEPMERQWL